MFMPFKVTEGTIVHFMTVSLTRWLRYSQLMLEAVLVGDAYALHSEWLESVSPLIGPSLGRCVCCYSTWHF